MIDEFSLRYANLVAGGYDGGPDRAQAFFSLGYQPVGLRVCGGAGTAVATPSSTTPI
jgi:hypothetical protein